MPTASWCPIMAVATRRRRGRSLDAQPPIDRRRRQRAEILLDGGIRRGSDVIKALCLGAKAVCIGRPYLYGLAARGPDGVAHVLQIFREEIARAMTLMGVGRVADLDESWLLPADCMVGTPAWVHHPKPEKDRSHGSRRLVTPLG